MSTPEQRVRDFVSVAESAHGDMIAIGWFDGVKHRLSMADIHSVLDELAEARQEIELLRHRQGETNA